MKGSLSVATVLILFNYFTSLGTPAITLMGNILDFLTEMNLSCERLNALGDERSFPKEKFGIIEKKEIKGAVKFENVRFSYNISKLKTSTRWVLYDMNFEIHPGETVALVGRSGSGKTTIINLISSSILMLDEATSALDNITQARIQQAIENIRGQNTIIMIAHRLSTVIGADRILFVQDGCILAQGTHQELMDNYEAYRELYMMEEYDDQEK